ncbi:MAG: hypothetical protein K6B68_01585 [Eubacterium sp.]|nr:hypothetical protein [Eubacterium sp.]
MRTEIIKRENSMLVMMKFIRAAVLIYTVLMCFMYSGEINTGHVGFGTGCRQASYVSTVYAKKDDPDGGGTDSSGVSELDSAKTRTDGLVVWFCHWIGGVVAVIAFIVFLFMAGTHQTEQRNTALVVMIMGIAVYFAPSIVNYVLGKSIF